MKQRKAISHLLTIPFLLMIILSIFSVGAINGQSPFGVNRIGGNGSAVYNKNCAINGINCDYGNGNCNNINTCLIGNQNPNCSWDFACYFATAYCYIKGGIGTTFNITPDPNCITQGRNGITIGDTLNGGGILTIGGNPFTNPLGFFASILIVLSVIAIASLTVFGTSILNAGTAYIIFLVTVIAITWTSLLSNSSAIFETFPCYGTIIQTLVSCNASPSIPNELIVSTGWITQILLSLSVALGTVDLVAI